MIEEQWATLIAKAKAHYHSLTPEQQAELWKAQRESWARGEMAFGNDKDEAKYREEMKK